MTILIPADFWRNGLVRGSDDFLCEYFIIFTIEVVFSILELLFKACKRVFNRIVVWRVRRKKFESTAFVFNDIFEILL